jgi:hypothetical protein
VHLVESPKGVSFLGHVPRVLMVVLSQHDAQLRRKTLQEEMGEEDAGLVAPWAQFQHSSQQLRRLAASQRLHPEQQGYPLIVIELMRLQQPLLESRKGVVAWRILHDVEDQADSLLGQCCHQVIISGLFTDNPV